jgi:glycosyltransferase involved in cell wall biosynthesis
MNPKISVITPCRNMASFLEDCMESIFGQNYPNLEYIVIDGASTDSTVEVVKRYEGRLAYWVSEPDRGQSHAINKGFAKATGDLLVWMNADDYFLPGAFAEVAAAWSAAPGAPFYFGDGMRVDVHKKVKSGFTPSGKVRFDRQALLLGLNYILQPSTFIDRKSFEECGGLDESLHFGMDSDLWMRLSGRGTPVPIQAVLSASREYESTKTSTGSFSRIEELRQISSKYSGREMTPGVLCYFFDELLRFRAANPDLLSAEVDVAIRKLWGATAADFSRFNAGPDGFPLNTTGRGV